MVWTCDRCTYINTAAKSKGCTMCGQAPALPKAAPVVAPKQAAPSNKRKRVVDDSDDDVEVLDSRQAVAAPTKTLPPPQRSAAPSIGSRNDMIVDSSDEEVSMPNSATNRSQQRLHAQQAPSAKPVLLLAPVKGMKYAASSLPAAPLSGSHSASLNVISVKPQSHARTAGSPRGGNGKAVVLDKGDGGGWPDKHGPASLADVALAPKKLQEVSDWISTAFSAREAEARRAAEAARARHWPPRGMQAAGSAAEADDDWDIPDEELDAVFSQLEQGGAFTQQSSVSSQAAGAGAGSSVGGQAGWGSLSANTVVNPPSLPSSMPVQWSQPASTASYVPSSSPVAAAVLPRLLIFAGPPGVGKSTAVRLMAQQAGMQLKVWNEAESRAAGAGSTVPAWLQGAYRGDDEDGEDGLHRALGRVYLSSGGGSWDGDDLAFRGTAGAGGRGGGGGRGKAGKAALAALEPFSLFLGTTAPKPPMPTAHAIGSSLLAPKATSSAAGAGAGAGAGAWGAPKASTASATPTLLMIEEIPRIPGGSTDRSHAREWRDALSEVFLRHLTSPVPGPPSIIVTSEGEEPGEPACRPSLARLLGTAVLDHPGTVLVEVGRIPDGRMKKALRSVAAAERLPQLLPVFAGVTGDDTPGVEGGEDDVQEVPLDTVPLEDILDTVIASARGDLRHAIMTLQMLAEQTASARAAAAARLRSQPVAHAGAKRKAAKAADAPPSKRAARNLDEDSGDAAMLIGDGRYGQAGHSMGPGGAGAKAGAHSALRACGRDDFFDVLHTFGKMLYGKRDPATGKLENDPDGLAAACAYDSSAITAFLHENAPPFFTDIDDLANAMDVYSMTDVLLGCENRGSTVHGRTGAFPEAHASALASRAVSTHNLHPAPTTFRAIHKPVMYGVDKARVANVRWLTEECLGLSNDLGPDAVRTSPGIGGSLMVGLTPTYERAVSTLPALGMMLNAARASVAKFPGAVPPWVQQQGISLRAEALLCASCAYGNATKVRSGEVTSTLGGQVSAALLAGMGMGMGMGMGSPTAAGAGAGEDEFGADDAGRRYDEEDAEEATRRGTGIGHGSSGVASSWESEGVEAAAGGTPLAATPMLTAQKVSTVGLLAGMWEAHAALRGVDVTRPPAPVSRPVSMARVPGAPSMPLPMPAVPRAGGAGAGGWNMPAVPSQAATKAGLPALLEDEIEE